ncbi:hypothetical protein Cgig2_028182 [Carnegiea gigantea]|uniref:Uncharacterized protein n=1 Tax=Carnegiea gigantea TaxID=171969 RepID=A0A9Q1GUW1_9CARY|nr:hypothetical protein Cgig2_028182 [Carnegiea gigantea]
MEKANPESEVGCQHDMLMPIHTPEGNVICTAWELSFGTVEVSAAPLMKIVRNAFTMDGESYSMEHGLTIAPGTNEVEAAAVGVIGPFVDPLMGPLLGTVIAYQMRHKCRKLTIVHGTPYANPNQPLGGWKMQKESKQGMMTTKPACANSDSTQGSLDLEEEDLKECLPKLVPTSRLRGLINVILKVRAGNRPRRYFINYFVINMFTELFHTWQQTFPKPWMSIFFKSHTNVRYCFLDKNNLQEVILHNKARILGKIWNSFKMPLSANLRYMFMSLLKITESHWFHSITYLCEDCFFVYDSLSSAGDKNRDALVDSAVSHNSCCVKYRTNVVLNVDAGIRDCICICIRMECHVLAYGLYFNQDYVAHYKDKFLLSFMQGRIAHFSDHLRGKFSSCATLSLLQYGDT